MLDVGLKEKREDSFGSAKEQPGVKTDSVHQLHKIEPKACPKHQTGDNARTEPSPSAAEACCSDRILLQVLGCPLPL